MDQKKREGVCQSLSFIAEACEHTHAEVTEAQTDGQASVAAYSGLYTIRHMVAQLLQSLEESEVITPLDTRVAS